MTTTKPKYSLFWDPPSAPPTALGRHRVLSSRAGVRVSPLCYGAMSLGTTWEYALNSKTDEEQSHKMLDYFYEQGGNFIDTANAYQNGESEKFIGSWIKKRGNRDELVIATKYTSCFYDHSMGARIATNYGGNSLKSLKLSVENSLKSLQTDYIDLLYIHWWDWTTGVEEVMRGLNQLVQSGKVLYLGVSDTPAWIVAKAQMYARQHGLAEFAVYQGKWNAMERDFEREILPMARDFGMALAPWRSLGGGRFRTAEQVAERERTDGAKIRGNSHPTETETAIAEVLQKIGKESFGGASIAQMAIAYVMSKAQNVFPIIGTSKPAQLEDAIKALHITLTPEQIKEIEAVTDKDFKLGFPMEVVGRDPHEEGVSVGAPNHHGGYIDLPKYGRPASVPKDAP